MPRFELSLIHIYVEPCVFAHYANANIRETTLLDALKSPIFMQYYERQPLSLIHI